MKAELMRPSPPTPDRPPGITCEKYVRGEGKRCSHYLAGGRCTLPGESLCIEWLKANPAAPLLVPARTPASPAVPTDLFGRPEVRQAARSRAASKLTSLPAPDRPSLADVPAFDIVPIHAVTNEDIESFKALGVEVCLASDAVGEVWLVPAYTRQRRREISPEHLATVLRALVAFPGARVTAIQPSPHKENRP